MKMYNYRTFQILNLSTSQPFEFSINFKEVRRHHKNLKHIVVPRNTDRGIHLFLKYCSPQRETSYFELLMFPIYEEFLKVMFHPRDPNSLLMECLRQFGASDEQIEKLMNNPRFVSSAMSYFEGITCDGERSLRTMRHVYNCAVKALEDENADLRDSLSVLLSEISKIEIC